MKMILDRDQIIKGRLQKMTAWSRQRREFLQNLPYRWNAEWYIRIGGNGFTAVSLNHDRPMLGFNTSPVANIETVVQHFKRDEIKVLGRKTPEKCAQAWLIKQAITHKLDLTHCMGLEGSVYDKLLFAFDELSFGDRDHGQIVRLDMLAVGVCADQAYPVLIELKSDRELGKLMSQLQEYQYQVSQYKQEFKELLTACVNEDVNMKKFGKILIWPKSTSGRSSHRVGSESKHYEVTVIEGNASDWSTIKEFSFNILYVYPPR